MPNKTKFRSPCKIRLAALALAVPAGLFGFTAVVAAQTGAAPKSKAQTPAPKIKTFEVRGVRTLGAADIRAATRPLIGQEQNSTNVRRAIEAIESLYRAKGNSRAKVFLATDDKTSGVVAIEVVEAEAVSPPPAKKSAVEKAAGEPLPAPVIERFAIRGFDLKGVKVVDADEIRRATERFLGEGRDFGSVQMAIDEIEALYRRKGYGAVLVTLPEQDISAGRIVIEIIETPLGKVTVTGNRSFSPDNIRRSLVDLREGQTPNTRAISQNVLLANENPGKQIEVVLAVGEQENTVDARVEVKEDQVRRYFVTVDNTGTPTTGDTRLGVGFLHNNLFDRDHAASVAYTTSPDAPSGTDLNVLSLSYRVPFYARGESLTLLYGYSDVSTPAAQSATAASGQGLAINGKGHLASARWTFHRPRQGEYASQITAGIDWKLTQSTCQSEQAVGDIAGCVDTTTLPLSLAYGGRLDGLARQIDYTLGLSVNVPSGKEYTVVESGRRDHYSLAAGNREAKDNFTVIRTGGSYNQMIGTWALRAAINGQYATDGALVASEQLGLTGAQAVRGFLDRIVVADSGAVLSVEWYTPELAPRLGLARHNLRALAFVDAGYGHDNNSADGRAKKLASWGFGARYQFAKDIAARLDAANIALAEPEGVHQGTRPQGGAVDRHEKGDWRLHAALLVSF